MSDQSNNEDLVFIKLQIMLGDADGWIKEYGFMTAKEWREEIAIFQEYVARTGDTEITRENDMYGEYHWSLENYTVVPCTAAEKATVEKFFGPSYGVKLLSDYTSHVISNEDYEAIISNVT